MSINIDKIVQLRSTKGLSIKKISELLDITTRTIYNWERGKSSPSKAELIALSHLYNVRLREISDYKDFPLFYTKPTLLNKNETSPPSSEYISGLIEQLKSIPGFNFYPVLKIINEFARLTLENKKYEQKIKRLSSILDSIDSIIYTIDGDHKIRFYNKQFYSLVPQNITDEKISGRTLKEIFGSNHNWNAIVEIERSVLSSGVPAFSNDIKILPDKTKIYIYPLADGKNGEIITSIS